jgi:hypothetical protein
MGKISVSLFFELDTIFCLLLFYDSNQDTSSPQNQGPVEFQASLHDLLIGLHRHPNYHRTCHLQIWSVLLTKNSRVT